MSARTSTTITRAPSWTSSAGPNGSAAKAARSLPRATMSWPRSASKLATASPMSAADGLTNVQTVLGEDRASGLPAGSVDVIFHCDTYHHFEYPMSMNRDLARALVVGGELFVLEFERIPGVTPDWVLEHVRAGKAVVREELEGSGFTFVEELAVPGLKDNYLLRFKKSS